MKKTVSTWIEELDRKISRKKNCILNCKDTAHLYATKTILTILATTLKNKNDINGKYFVVIDMQSRIQAVAKMHFLKGIYTEKSPVGFIDIFVKSPFKNAHCSGAGKLLLLHLANYVRRQNTNGSLALLSLRSARPFYRHFGFYPLGKSLNPMEQNFLILPSNKIKTILEKNPCTYLHLEDEPFLESPEPIFDLFQKKFSQMSLNEFAAKL